MNANKIDYFIDGKSVMEPQAVERLKILGFGEGFIFKMQRDALNYATPLIVDNVKMVGYHPHL